jgi:hypothetical protein
MLPLQLGFHPWTIPEAIFGAAKMTVARSDKD